MAILSPRRTREARRIRANVIRAFAATVLVGLACVGAADRSAADSRPWWTSPLVPLVVVHGFDPPAGPYAPGHRGVDLAGTAGQSVFAAGDGVVTYAGQVGGIGVVAISHGEITTTYQPLWWHIVAGAAVSAGERIGQLAPVSSHCAPDACLHWGAVLHDAYIDPLSLLNPGPSRLLPYWDSSDGARAPTGSYEAPARVSAPERAPVAIAAAGSPTRVMAATSARLTSERVERLGVVDDADGSIPPAAAAAIAILGGVLAGVSFVAIRRRRG